MGPLVLPTNRDCFSGLSGCADRFPGISRRTYGGNGLKFCMLMNPDHLQNWLDYGHRLLIFLLLASLLLSETGKIWDFRAFSGERNEGAACNFACWCILTTFRTDYIIVRVCWYFKFWCYFDFVKWVKFVVTGYFLENKWREWPEILYADVAWLVPSELIRFWSWSVDFPLFGVPLN